MAHVARPGLHSAAHPLLRARLPAGRSRFVVAAIAFAFLLLVARAVFLQLLSNDYLQAQGEMRYGRTLETVAQRGAVYDRNGRLLAVSRSVRAIVASPRHIKLRVGDQAKLAGLLGMRESVLADRLGDPDRTFVYLKRQVEPALAARIDALGIRGISALTEFRREYPAGERAAQIVGFMGYSDNDGDGQRQRGRAGVERMFDDALTGRPGVRRVIQDPRGSIVENVGEEVAPINGSDIRLSIDSELQFHAYRAIQAAAQEHRAKAAAAVVLDIASGEVLALANWPSHDPNDRAGMKPGALRNRALLDTFEPGSTMKPFTIALALDARRIGRHGVIDTSPGHMLIGRQRIADHGKDHGRLSIAEILAKSSNVGTVKIAMTLPPAMMGEFFAELGFGQAPPISVPGVAAGRVRPHRSWKPIEQATMSYGHGLSVSLMQIARAYTVFARDGDLAPLSLVREPGVQPGHRVMSSKSARTVLAMLEGVVGVDGTAPKASVSGYRVGGKTGTAYKVKDGRYVKQYVSSFVGIAPLSNPRLVVAVMIDEPSNGKHYAGDVAAPVFSKIVAESMRHLRIAPDAAQPPVEIPVPSETGATR